MPDERLEVSVTFDERGYVASAPEAPVGRRALSLGGLRRKTLLIILVPSPIFQIHFGSDTSHQPKSCSADRTGTDWRLVFCLHFKGLIIINHTQ